MLVCMVWQSPVNVNSAKLSACAWCIAIRLPPDLLTGLFRQQILTSLHFHPKHFATLPVRHHTTCVLRSLYRNKSGVFRKRKYELPCQSACQHNQMLALKFLNFYRLRLNWPEGAAHRKSVSAVQKLASLRKLLQDLGDNSVSHTSQKPPACLTQSLEYMLCYFVSIRTSNGIYHGGNAENTGS